MKKRQISIIAAVLILVIGLFSIKVLTGKSDIQGKKKEQDNIRMVQTLRVKNATIQSQIPITGRLKATKQIELFAEVQGKMLFGKKPFREGVFFDQNDVIFEIEDTEARLSLQALRSSFMNSITQLLPDFKLDYPNRFEVWNTYLLSLDPSKELEKLPVPATDQEKHFITAKNLYNLYFNVKSLENKLLKYKTKAPFEGTLSSTLIQEGALIRAGQKLGELTGSTDFELESAINIKDLPFVRKGNKVLLVSKETNHKWEGVISRILNKIDPQTQSIKIYIALTGDGLKDGLYLQGDIEGGEIKNAFQIDRKLVHDDSLIYVVDNSALQKLTLRIAKMSGNTVIATNIPDNTEILSEVIANTYPGMPVQSIAK